MRRIGGVTSLSSTSSQSKWATGGFAPDAGESVDEQRKYERENRVVHSKHERIVHEGDSHHFVYLSRSLRISAASFLLSRF